MENKYYKIFAVFIFYHLSSPSKKTNRPQTTIERKKEEKKILNCIHSKCITNYSNINPCTKEEKEIIAEAIKTVVKQQAQEKKLANSLKIRNRKNK